MPFVASFFIEPTLRTNRCPPFDVKFAIINKNCEFLHGGVIMWPFKKKKEDDTLIMIRYTKDTWFSLFPDSTVNEWEVANSPLDVAKFVKLSVSNSLIGSRPIQRGIIATIDKKYLEWMSLSKLEHSSTTLSQYFKTKIADTNYWNDRLLESEMTGTYNILGIPSLVMLHNISGSKTEYVIDKETSSAISELLLSIYGGDAIFTPGWITKGCDMPTYSDDLIQLAEIFWQEGKRIRFGKCLEQSYNNVELADKFAPLYFIVPFVIKTNVDSALINFSGRGFTANDQTCQAMAAKRFSEEQRVELFKLISSSIPQVISVGPRAVIPSQAYINYAANIIRCKSNANVTMY